MSDLLSYMLLGGYGGRGGGFGKKKKKKAKKTPKANWFEELNADQCKQLCKAAKLKVSGSKQDLVGRLVGSDATSDYAPNGRSYYNISVEGLKERARERLLQVGGNKFDLVLRMVQHDCGTGGGSLKRAATETVRVVDEATGETKEVQVAKKRKVARPSAYTYYNRVQKKIQAVHQKKYQSHWGSKSHAPDVGSLMQDLFHTAKTYVETEPLFAFELITAIFTSLNDNFDTFVRPGYFEQFSSMVESLHFQMTKLKPHLTPEQREETATWMLDLSDTVSGYCLEHYADKDKNLSATANLLRDLPLDVENKGPERRHNEAMMAAVSALSAAPETKIDATTSVKSVPLGGPAGGLLQVTVHNNVTL